MVLFTISILTDFSKHMNKSVIPALLSLFLGLSAFAQVEISGQIKDDSDEGMPIVNVVEKGTTNGVVSDIMGNFTITVSDPNNAVLVFSFLGYTTQEVALEGRTSISVSMAPDVASLEEVVVVGYGTTTKKEVTGSTSQVKGESLEKLNIPRVDQALQGQVAGVSINTNSGSPGGSSSIRIRGLSTFGDNDPLILVDGVVYDSEGLNALNPSDIESVNVLKDATAGIYGVRAANGVILITTKKGEQGAAPTVDISSYYGIQEATRQLPLLNGREYAIIKNETFGSSGEGTIFNNTEVGEGTDWQSAVFQQAAIQNHSVSVTGGSKATSYSIGGAYFTQDGIVGGDKSTFTRYNGRVNMTTELGPRFRLSSVLLYTHEDRSALPENGIGSVLYNTINAFPTEPIYTNDGNFSYLEEVSDIINPIAQMQNTYTGAKVDKLVGKEELAFDINENFTFTNRISYNYALVDDKTFSPLVWYGPGKAQNTAINEDLDPSQVEIADGIFIERGASVYEQRATYRDVTFESFLNYNKKFAEHHSVKGTLGASVFNRRGEGLNGTAFNIPNNALENADISANQAPGGYLNATNSFQFEERLLSTFLRAEYGYKYKYLVSAILRRDGSTKFGPNNRYGYFPTVSTAWVLSEEDFFKSKALSFAKVRLSYGVSGNDQIENFAYRAQLNGEGAYVFNDVIAQGVAIGRASNPDLRWETTSQFNAGLDLTIGRGFNVTTNYFVKSTRDLLFQPEVSGVLGTYGPGGSPPVINAGDVRNTGVELELAYNTNPYNAFVFNSSFNMTYLRNEVISTPDGVDFLPGAQFGVGGNVATRFEQGQPIGYFVGFETDGIWQSQEEIDAADVVQPGAQPGDLRFVDQNGDGEINFNDDSDKTALGSPIPDFVFGLNLRGSYKGFDLSANIYTAIGQEIIRNYERQQPYANQLNYIIGRWTGENTSTDVPRQTIEPNRNTEFSDYYVEDGSFMRLRNVQLGYTFGKAVAQKIKFKSIRIYASVNNLLTLTNYQGYDPDIGSFGGALSAGVDYGFYPQARTVMGGINLKF